jgi:hypothetical protein
MSLELVTVAVGFEPFDKLLLKKLQHTAALCGTENWYSIISG